MSQNTLFSADNYNHIAMVDSGRIFALLSAAWHPCLPPPGHTGLVTSQQLLYMFTTFIVLSPYTLYSGENHVLLVTICYWLWKLCINLQPPMYKLKGLEPVV